MLTSETRFLNLTCFVVGNGTLELLIPREVGPRLLALRVDGQNLFAEVPDGTLECPGRGLFRFLGGHRLWHAPEMPRRTYIPDDRPVSVIEEGDGIAVYGQVEEGTFIRKGIRVRLPDETPTVLVEHVLENHGLWPVECAPWAITQLRPGGWAILPQTDIPADPDGVLPNRRLALWPYTDIRSSWIRWGNRYIFISATMTGGALKIGFPNSRRWLAYVLEDLLFVKWAAWQPDADYYDEGSSHECFCSPDFLELETLGPRTVIPPGGQAVHREVWRVFRPVDFHPDESAADRLVEAFKLEEDHAWLSGN